MHEQAPRFASGYRRAADPVKNGGAVV